MPTVPFESGTYRIQGTEEDTIDPKFAQFTADYFPNYENPLNWWGAVWYPVSQGGQLAFAIGHTRFFYKSATLSIECTHKSQTETEYTLRFVAPSLELRDDFAFGHTTIRDNDPATSGIQGAMQFFKEKKGYPWPKFRIKLPTDETFKYSFGYGTSPKNL
jgi:hypothetical protein